MIGTKIDVEANDQELIHDCISKPYISPSKSKRKEVVP